jgi:hypothetical protein
VTEENAGSRVVVVDQDDCDEPLHDLDSPAASGGLLVWGLPSAVVHDLQTDGAGFGPEGQLDGVVGGGRGVGVLDAVARRLVDGEYQVVLGVAGQGERGQPATGLGAAGRDWRDAPASCGARIRAVRAVLPPMTARPCRLLGVLARPRSCSECANEV